MRIEEWRKIIHQNFTGLVLPAEIGLSVACQLLIDDISNPFGLIYVDVPSSGKTIVLNFFSDCKNWVYTTDSFSPASFVSQAANVKTKDLPKIDLLPKIKDKILIVRDLAPLFGMRDDDLLKTISILTRIFDGEGYRADGGVHGSRGYDEECLFMFLSASTPIRPRVWRVMGNFGARLFFYNFNAPDKSTDTLANQLSAEFSPKQKEKVCREATFQLLNDLFNCKDGVLWDKQADNRQFLEEIAIIAQLVACLRGTINVWEEHAADGKFNHTEPQIEKPDRINQCLYNLARGHAVACGRTSLNDQDIAIVLRVALCSASLERTKLLNKLIENDGVLITEDVIHKMEWSRTSALKYMEVFRYLRIVEEISPTNPQVGRSEKVIKLTEQFSWLLSNRFKELQLLTASDLVN